MPYRVLTLDGGGAWALIQVRTLMRLFGDGAQGHKVLGNFDLVAANSAGSLVLAGLVEDLPLSDILLYFLDNDKRSSIFSPTTKPGDDAIRTILGFGPKYSASAKLPAIQRLLPKTGDLLLDGITKEVTGLTGLPVHLLIVGFDYDLNRAVFFRSATAAGTGWGEGEPAQVTLAEAVHASTNAPINYFDAPATFPFAADQYWDGGITGCNNPTVVAVVEAVVLGHALTDLRVLSLGTGSVSKPLAAAGAPHSPYETARSVSTLPGDINKLAMAILDDPPDAASFIAHVMTGGSVELPDGVVSRIVRMSPLISPVKDATGRWTAPPGMTAAIFEYLSNIDMDAQIPYDIILLDEYCTAWLGDYAPNQPIRANGKTSDPNDPEIGYAKFSDAFAAWRVLFPNTQA